MSNPMRTFFILAAFALFVGFVERGPAPDLTGAPGAAGVSDRGMSIEGGTGGAIDDLTPGVVSNGAATTSGGPGAGPGTGVQGPQARSLSCAPGRNGGRTDVGVSGTGIRLATTAVLSGVAASLLRDSPTGMKAVIDKVNAAGGICGRRLNLEVVDDGFDARLGQQFIRNFIAGDYFALPVVPSAEGLSSAITSGIVREAGIPVVGTDGMRKEQYGDPYVWPVATATRSTMRVMAEYGFRKRNARTFGIVYDQKYKFGVEGRQAFEDQVEKLGGRMQSVIGLDSEQTSYGSQVQKFNTECGGGKCDMVALLLLPDTARTWLEQGATLGRVYSAGAQTLFTDQFAQGCEKAVKSNNRTCHGLAVWTGYNPPIGRYAGLPDVARYVDDVRTISPGIDVRNQFLEGAYLGMNVFVEALKKVGPNLTRARLRAVLDSMTHGTDLASRLSWKQGRHAANVRARAFAIVVSQGKFEGWRDENTGWVEDPAAG